MSCHCDGAGGTRQNDLVMACEIKRLLGLGELSTGVRLYG